MRKQERRRTVWLRESASVTARVWWSANPVLVSFQRRQTLVAGTAFSLIIFFPRVICKFTGFMESKGRAARKFPALLRKQSRLGRILTALWGRIPARKLEYEGSGQFTSLYYLCMWLAASRKSRVFLIFCESDSRHYIWLGKTLRRKCWSLILVKQAK